MGSDPRPDDLLIREQSDLALIESPDGDGVFNADGTVNMVIVRPCNGRGPGQRIYETDVLAREGDANTFVGWPMFDNHDSPAARKARMGLPRPPSELAGVIREHHWDSEFSTDEDDKYGYGPGAVVARCALSDPMEALVRKLPEAIKGSLNAQATSMRMGSRNGKRGWIVEGIVNDPENSSFDLVTKAGAGGRVRSLLESLYRESSDTDGLSILEVEADDVNLQEALQSDEVKTYLGTMIKESVGEIVTEALTEALPTALEEHGTAIREAVREEVGQAGRLRSLHGEAMRLIEAAKLPDTAKANLLEDYGITENDDETVTPHRLLAVIEAELDGDGNVTKPAKTVLSEAITADVERQRNVLREAAPTVPSARGIGADSAGATTGPSFGGEHSKWAARMRQRGLDPAQFGAPKPAEPNAAATT